MFPSKWKWVSLCLMKPSEGSSISNEVESCAGGKQTQDWGNPRRDAVIRETSFTWTNSMAFCCQKASISLLLLLLPQGSSLVLLLLGGSLIWKKNQCYNNRNELFTNSQGIAKKKAGPRIWELPIRNSKNGAWVIRLALLHHKTFLCCVMVCLALSV